MFKLSSENEPEKKKKKMGLSMILVENYDSCNMCNESNDIVQLR